MNITNEFMTQYKKQKGMHNNIKLNKDPTMIKHWNTGTVLKLKSLKIKKNIFSYFLHTNILVSY